VPVNEVNRANNCVPYSSDIYILQQLSEAPSSSSSKAYKSFAVRVELLPSFIPIRAAEKILFVGESVQMFENQKDSGPKQINRGMLDNCTNTVLNFSLILTEKRTNS